MIILAALGLTMGLAAQKQNTTYLAYLAQWKQTAVENQADYGIPASIIMAQALLESSAGQSELAVNANNHFGIKCTSEWFGGVYYYDDDSKGECFRQYNNAAESFKDHALFLLRPRYATCFEIAVEDYEGWARRLKACGYATDPSYASKLVKIIEDYRLDTLAASQMSAPEVLNDENGDASLNDEPQTPNDTASQSNDAPADTLQVQKTKRPLKAEVVQRTEPIAVITHDPDPEYVAPLTAKQERDSFFMIHPKLKCNNTPYVLAREGDTYANVAFRLNVRERDLREYNDALGRDLQAGDRIYLFYKKKTGDKDYVWTSVGQSFWQLAQDEGVMLQALQQLNGIDPSVRVFKTKQKLYLKKVKVKG